MNRSTLYFLLIITSFIPAGCRKNHVRIEDTVNEKGRKFFTVSGESYRYIYDRAGGGFSSIFDQDSIDWIGFRPDSAGFPEGAAGIFRGLPNLVYGSEDNGAGHPGFNKCTSRIKGSDTILTRSNSGKWEWSWVFRNRYAVMTMIKSDPDHPYWFLYEGTVAGKFQPHLEYWGTDLGGPWNNIPDYYFDDAFFQKFHWIYFGNENIDRVFFIAQIQADDKPDLFAYLGNSREGVISPEGMVVAGFGRFKGSKALLTKSGLKFIIGFYDKKIRSPEVHKEISGYIGNLIEMNQ